jgi:hypothetical protein
MNRPVDQASNRNTAPDGARSLGAREKKGWLLWLILGLLFLAAVAIWAIVHNRNNDKDKSSTDNTVAMVPSPVRAGNGATVTAAGPTTAGGSTATVTAIAPGAAAGNVTGGAGGSAVTTATTAGGATTATIPPAPGPTTPLAANGQDLVAVSSTSAALAGLVDQPATGQATVQSVVSDEGFWVGTSEQNRVFVFLSTEARGSSGESPFQVVGGQTVEIAGTLVSTDGRIPADVTARDGLQQLTDQHVLINATSLALVK